VKRPSRNKILRPPVEEEGEWKQSFTTVKKEHQRVTLDNWIGTLLCKVRNLFLRRYSSATSLGVILPVVVRALNAIADDPTAPQICALMGAMGVEDRDPTVPSPKTDESLSQKRL
jgi:hypothetical protein